MASTIAKSIHVHTTPAPRSIAESKLVLAALQKFGEVATFRNFKYEPNKKSLHAAQNTIAIFASATAASNAISSSPLTVPRPLDGGGGGPPLTCTIQASRHNHEAAMARNPYHEFFVVENGSHVYEEMMRTGVPLEGLADGPMGRKMIMGKKESLKLGEEVERLGGRSLMGLFREGVENGSGEGGGVVR
ncbi:hypothetical protein BO71DRAFT_375431 [Aspergillus ellipticus CBS 707.79]|uniref:Uncharacterized protein n=1 Tax=Aspergillus ellipticus CBS 707.79 TaxID=1448320 RepID=A0A319DFY0_9EURO|nr:hypothetical protein BO71DRAFT_375431 [Aspergillus ellipticus CBS 707.79]